MLNSSPNNSYKLIAILRIKDQIDTVDECLAKLSELVDAIVLLDNGSTDGTLERYKVYPKVIEILQTEGYHEGRDKIMLLEAAKKYNPEWLLWIDADEIFEKNTSRKVFDSYMNSYYNRITFRLCHFWLDRIHCRIDAEYFLYSLHPQRSMWRNLPEAFFKDSKMHNGDIQGLPGPTYLSPYRLKHYGYSDAVKMKQKYDQYMREDLTGKRDYSRLNPSLAFKSYRFREFASFFTNTVYIYLFKYVCGLLWLYERIRRRIVKK